MRRICLMILMLVVLGCGKTSKDAADIEKRIAEMKALAHGDDKAKAVELLRKVISDRKEDQEVRLGAADLLVEIDGAAALALLKTIAQDRDEKVDVRCEIAKKWADKDRAQAVPVLKSMLSDREEAQAIRLCAADLLKKSDAASLPAMFIAIIKHRKEKSTLKASVAERWVDVELAGLLKGCSGDEEEAGKKGRAALLQKMRSEPTVVTVLEDQVLNKTAQDVKLRCVAADVLLDHDKERVASHLKTILRNRDDEPDVRTHMVGLIRKLDAASLPDMFSTIVKDRKEKPEMRARIAEIWRKDDPGTVKPILTKILEDKDDKVEIRWRVSAILAEIDNEGTIGLLIKILEDEEEKERMRWRAAERLGGMKLKEAVPSLIKALRSPSLAIREAAAAALVHLADPSATAPLIEILMGRDFDSRYYAARILGDLGTKAAVLPLIEALERADAKPPYAVAVALGKLKDLAAAPALSRSLEADDPLVVNAAREALVAIAPPKEVVPGLKERLEVKDAEAALAAAVVLAKLGDRAGDKTLRAALDSENEWARYYAVQGLAALGADAAKEALRKALADSSYLVRATAAATMPGQAEAEAALKARAEAEEEEEEKKAPAWVRERAITALAAFKNAAPILRKALKDPDPYVKIASAAGLMTYDRLVCTVQQRHQADLDEGKTTQSLRDDLKSKGVLLYKRAVATAEEKGRVWLVKDGGNTYVFKKEADQLSVYRRGDNSGIPVLVDVLSESKSAGARQVAMETLSRLTKQEFGYDHREWSEWWKTEKRAGFQLKTGWIITLVILVLVGVAAAVVRRTGGETSAAEG